MHTGITLVAGAATVAALSALGTTGASASGSATRDPAHAPAVATSHVVACPGTRLWLKRYNNPANGEDYARSVAVSPDGDRVFVTGASYSAIGPDGTPEADYLTVAYNAATGARLWLQRYNGPANESDRANSVAVSPTGGKVFVTGESSGAGLFSHPITIAYSAATGAQLWVKRSTSRGWGVAAAVSPNAAEVLVTGATSARDYLTVAYSAATGTQLWAKRYNGPGNGDDEANSIAISPTGDKVFVTGYSAGATSGQDYATVAYNAVTGAQLWAKRYNRGGDSYGEAHSVAVSPGGGRVFVTGSAGATADTVAYSAATGVRLWVKRFTGYANWAAYAFSVAASPTADRVFVTGSQITGTSSSYATTIAYNATTGAPQWITHYRSAASGYNIAYAIAVSHTGGKVFVTGYSTGATSGPDYLTVAYSAATGTQLWAKRYNGPGNDEANSIAISPIRDKVFVTGYSTRATSGPDYTTIAYHG